MDIDIKGSTWTYSPSERHKMMLAQGKKLHVCDHDEFVVVFLKDCAV
jgi:hypothetical protein